MVAVLGPGVDFQEVGSTGNFTCLEGIPLEDIEVFVLGAWLAFVNGGVLQKV